MTEKNLLPEQEYRAWDTEMIGLRKKATELTIRFNTTGDRNILKKMFDNLPDDVSIAPPLHCNYGGDFIHFGHRIFINANCTFQPAGSVGIGDDVYTQIGH